MPASLTTVNAILKEVYEGRIEGQMNEEYVATQRVEKSGDGIVDTVGGKYVTFPIRVARNAGISYRAEETQLAPPGNQGYAAVIVRLKYGYGRFRVSGQVMELADTNYQAFASGMDEEMNRLKDDLQKDQNRITHGNAAGNGVIAMITAGATSATQTVSQANLLQPGEIVDVLVVASGSATGGGTGLTVNSVDPATNTVVLSSSIGPTTTAMGVYRTGNRLQEPESFASICDTVAPLFGLDPATQPIWKGFADASGGTLAELKMIKMCDTARVNGGKTSVIFTSLGVRRAYFALLTQQRRYTDTKSYPGGFQGLPFNYGTEIPVVEDVDAPPGVLRFLDESKLKVYRRRGWHFADDDGNILKWVPDYDSWQGMMRQYWQLGVSQRNAQGSMTGVTES